MTTYATPVTENQYATERAAAVNTYGNRNVLDRRDPTTGQIIGLYVVSGCDTEGRLLRTMLVNWTVA